MRQFWLQLYDCSQQSPPSQLQLQLLLDASHWLSPAVAALQVPNVQSCEAHGSRHLHKLKSRLQNVVSKSYVQQSPPSQSQPQLLLKGSHLLSPFSVESAHWHSSALFKQTLLWAGSVLLTAAQTILGLLYSQLSLQKIVSSSGPASKSTRMLSHKLTQNAFRFNGWVDAVLVCPSSSSS